MSHVFDRRDSTPGRITGLFHIADTSRTKSDVYPTSILGRAVAQRLDAGFPPRRPGFAYGQHVGFVVDKAALG
jgi:hypothetical protein